MAACVLGSKTWPLALSIGSRGVVLLFSRNLASRQASAGLLTGERVAQAVEQLTFNQ